MANLTIQTTKVHLIIMKPTLETIKGYFESISFRSFLEANTTFYSMIIHDKDLLDNGSSKLPHIHIVFKGKEKKRLQTWLNMFTDFLHINEDALTINHAKKFVGNVRYLCHLDSPNKYSYPIDSIVTSDKEELLLLLNSTTDDLSFDALFDMCKSSSNRVQIMEKLGLQRYRLYRNVINDILRDLYRNI